MATVNITVENDADFYRQFQYATANPDGSAGPPINITGAALEMMLRWNAADDTAVLRLGTDTGEFVLTNPASGLFTLKISQSVLQQLALGTYAHSNIMTLGGLKSRIWSGQITINPGPTR
ncbi:hypothetical protein SAMN05443247_06578 [Bradyrhizobium erythrophlei]|nr:hypothetical protein SAMN05443247_06578 [Bradyrhizobium erythrophlei]